MHRLRKLLPILIPTCFCWVMAVMNIVAGFIFKDSSHTLDGLPYLFASLVGNGAYAVFLQQERRLEELEKLLSERGPK